MTRIMLQSAKSLFFALLLVAGIGAGNALMTATNPSAYALEAFAGNQGAAFVAAADKSAGVIT